MAYMQRVEDFETESEVMFNRLKLRRYLRELLLNQTRILQHKAEMVLKKEPGESNELDPYLNLIEHKKKESKTAYFEDKHQPSQLDNEIYNDIHAKGVDKLLNPDDFPDLYAWFSLIGQFSEKLRNSWK